jgi:hypothetical protein
VPDLAVEISLNALVEQLDDHRFLEASRDFRVASGLEPGAAPVPPLPELGRRDVFDATSELVASPRTDEAKRLRLTLLRRFAMQAYVTQASAGAWATLEARLQAPFAAVGRSWTPREAHRDVRRLAQREARVALALETSSRLGESLGDFGRLVEQTFEAAATLGHPYPTALELLQGRASAPRLAAARALLATTEDAARDLTAFALKRLESQPAQRAPQLHDVERAALAPWLHECFRREDLEHAVARCLGDLGFNPSAEGRITVDAEPRAGRVPGAQVFELEVPDQVRLVLTADLGFDAYAGWLRAWGVALHRAHVSRALPFVERRLGDGAVIDGVGRFFESFLLEEGWLKRYLRLTSPQAREASRLFALRQVLELRRTAARALAFEALCERGPGPAAWDDLRALLGTAAFAEVPPGLAPLELELSGGALLELDGWALESALHTSFLERFNEDFYRNPAAGRALAELAASGQRDDATVVAARLRDEATPTAHTLAVGNALGRRIARLGA